MKKLLALQLSILFIFAFSLAGQAQDSVRKTKPAKYSYPPKPYVKPGTYPAKPGYAAKPADYYKPKYYYKKPYDSAHAYHRPAVTDTGAAAKPMVLNDRSLNGQFQYLLTKVYFYQQPLLNAYHKSVMDTLAQARSALRASQGKMAVQSKMIDSLQNSIKSNDESLTETSAKVDSINMFGIVMSKSTYNLVMWGMVVIFGLIAIIVIARSGSYSREAKYRVQLYNELDEEYKNYKLKANEKEKKLARELQTERNRLDELLGGG